MNHHKFLMVCHRSFPGTFLVVCSKRAKGKLENRNAACRDTEKTAVEKLRGCLCESSKPVRQNSCFVACDKKSIVCSLVELPPGWEVTTTPNCCTSRFFHCLMRCLTAHHIWDLCACGISSICRLLITTAQRLFSLLCYAR